MIDERPATPGGELGGADLHTHPLPRSVRVALLLYAALLAVVFVALVVFYNQAQQSDERARLREKAANDRQVALVAAELDRRTSNLADELDRRTARRDAQRAADQKRLRATVCAVLPELRQTPALARLDVELGCPPSPSEARSVAPVPPAPRAAPQPQTPPQPTSTAPPAPRPRPTPTPEPAPRPTRPPSLLCILLGPVIPCR